MHKPNPSWHMPYGLNITISPQLHMRQSLSNYAESIVQNAPEGTTFSLQVNASSVGYYLDPSGEKVVSGAQEREDYRFDEEKCGRFIEYNKAWMEDDTFAAGFLDLEAPFFGDASNEVLLPRVSHMMEQFRVAYYALKAAFPSRNHSTAKQTIWSCWGLPLFSFHGNHYEGEFGPFTSELDFIMGGGGYWHHTERFKSADEQLKITAFKRARTASCNIGLRPAALSVYPGPIRRGEYQSVTDYHWFRMLQAAAINYVSLWIKDDSMPLPEIIERIEQAHQFCVEGTFDV